MPVCNAEGRAALLWATGARRDTSRREGAEGRQTCAACRRPALVVPLFLAALCSVMHTPARAQTDAPTYTNATRILSILGSSWMGSGYDNNGDAHYLFRPKDDMTEQDCAPRTGRPSKCAVEMLTLDLKNTPPRNSIRQGARYFNFTMMLHGNVFESSPGAQGFFEMPQQCSYERNHSVLAMFNASSSDVEFEILDTHSDKLGCFDTGSDGKSYDRCTGEPGGKSCPPGYTVLNGKKFKGKFRLGPKRLDDTTFTMHHLEIAMFFPYKHFDVNSWSDFSKRKDNIYTPVLNAIDATVSSWGTKKASQIFRFSLTPSPQRWMGPMDEWFRDRRPKILSVYPPFGPEEGGSIVTVRGVEFPEPEGSAHNASITLQHGFLTVDGVQREWGGQVRECCATHRLSDTEITCRLPRISCLHSNGVGKCSKPGAEFANQTVALAIKPSVKGYYPQGTSIPAEYDYPPPFQTSYPNGLDDFVSYEGQWELEDNDVYGGTFVRVADRIPGETHILNADQKTASGGSCCPVCKPESSGQSDCTVIIKQLSAGIYNVTIPQFLYPGGVGSPEGGSGVCDAATNFRNISLEVGIERSKDPTGFTPANALSVTSCIDMRGTCAAVPRVSIRETCKQLIWSTGAIASRLPLGQTVEVHEWKSNGKCDRRMRCVSGPCLWTDLASDNLDKTPENFGDPLFQRREASPQVGLEVQYKNDDFTADGFLAALAKLIPNQDTDPRRLQIVYYAKEKTIPLAVLGTTFAVREFQASESALCIPEAGRAECVDYNLIIYITSDGPRGDDFKVSLESLLQRARSPKGDPEFRKLNLMRVCVDLSWDPDAAAQNLPPDCIKVQYPGFLQFLTTQIRTKEEIWSYAKVGVTRTGGSDLGVTVDYETIELSDGNDTLSDDGCSQGAAGVDNQYAIGLGVDFSSKLGQLRWLEGDDNTKYIIVPIRWDGITELSEIFKIKIFNSVNARLATEPCPQFATVTIVGLNDTPEPRYIKNMQAIIGAVCGAATAVPCALLSARLIRSLRRGNVDPNKAGEEDDAGDEKAGADDGGFM